MNEPPHIRRVWAVANTAAGSVGPEAPAALTEIFTAHGLDAQVEAAAPAELENALRAAVAAKPDLLVVLAGDGTARAAAALAGPDGPIVMALPGGTLNMLPKALYGERVWRAALEDTLASPRVIEVAGGRVGEHAFFVAAILGAPALWADAREAVREGHPVEAYERAKLAISRAFSSRLRFRIEQEEELKAEALAVLCPLISPVLDDLEQVLEVAALDPSGLGDAVRLGLLASVGRWREDRTVHLAKARQIRVRAHHAIPAIVDGESIELGLSTRVEFTPRAFRALVPAA
ncbi:MAG: diacylglycerol kinase family lipid kinase [Caulobacteraceae bacterium]|nr:diacylglycerol kinase family lipid kinase [Caulobacteraceae bacterium]